LRRTAYLSGAGSSGEERVLIAKHIRVGDSYGHVPARSEAHSSICSV
jgi:hypothetical protein